MSQQLEFSPIMRALYHRQTETVNELLASGIKLNIHEAAGTGQTERLKELIAADPSLVNSYANDGFTPLGLAVFFGNPEAVDALLDAGADVNLPSREAMKVTPLASASASRQLEIARTLIAHGANVNARAANDFTPLHEAAASGKMDFAQLLIDHGADVNAKASDGKTPLDYAREHNRDEMVDLLTSYSD